MSSVLIALLSSCELGEIIARPSHRLWRLQDVVPEFRPVLCSVVGLKRTCVETTGRSHVVCMLNSAPSEVVCLKYKSESHTKPRAELPFLVLSLLLRTLYIKADLWTGGFCRFLQCHRNDGIWCRNDVGFGVRFKSLFALRKKRGCAVYRIRIFSRSEKRL